MRNGFAGEALNLTPDLVIYMGREAQNGRTDPRVLTEEDARIADGLMQALSGESVARGPSFDLGYPKVPGRDLEGIPNANDPVMREKLRQRLLKNPGGQEDIPSFLKRASAGGDLTAQVNPTYPAGDPRYGEPMNMGGQPLSLSESEYGWTQRMNELRRSSPSEYEKVKSMMGAHGWTQPPAGFRPPAGI